MEIKGTGRGGGGFLKSFFALGALCRCTFVVLAPIGSLGGQEMIEFFLEFVEEGHNFFFLEHVRDDRAIAGAYFEGGVDSGDGGLADFESISDCALRVAFHEHIGNRQAFAQHNLLDRREEVVEEIGGFGGRGERGE